MRLVTFVPGAGGSRSAWRFGTLLDDDSVLDLQAVLARAGAGSSRALPVDYLEWFDLDGPWLQAARRAHDALVADPAARGAAAREGSLIRAAAVTLLAPVPRPGKIVCVGLNYRDHAAEARLPVPESPVIFAKFATALLAPGSPIRLPAFARRVDYEAELAFAIGRRARHVPRDRAMAYVLGFTNANDVSARDIQKMDGQWVRAKSCDTFAPIGPAIVTLDEIAAPHALPIRLRLNGEVMQDSNTDQFVFGIPALVEFLSATMTLEPGDLVLTGTPPGVGFARRPPVYLRPGDVVEVEIGGLGVLRNPVVAGD
jgi:2-keto-4-pentenoate hydratase/2-oxohepta-3-ene-1,7-dioic acid hydratase in catechol pathway